jgi:3-phosphoshikimate 1-carboxyvinyltransferase
MMCHELTKMGADIEEMPDGLIIRKSELKGAELHGHADHRIIMALGVAGLAVENTTVIDTADALGVTFPEFQTLMNSVGAEMSIID